MVTGSKTVTAGKGDYLVISAVFSYKGYETKPGERDELLFPTGEKVLIVHRNRRSGTGIYFEN